MHKFKPPKRVSVTLAIQKMRGKYILYFLFGAFILSLITIGDVLIKFNGPKKLGISCSS
jgi:hypothetical protein